MYGMVCIDFRAILELAESLNTKEPVIKVNRSLIYKVHSLMFCPCLSCVPISTNTDRFSSIALLAQDEYGLNIGM